MVQIGDHKSDTKYDKVEPEEFAGNTLGGKFGNTILRVFKKLTNSITDWFEERLINFAVGVLVKVEQSGKTIFGTLIKELKDHNAIPPFLKPIFDEIEDPKHEIGALLASGAGTTAIGGLFGAIFDPLLASVKYNLNEAMSPYYPEINQAVLGKLAGTIDKVMLDEIIDAQGFDERFDELFKTIYKNHLPFVELSQLLLRGKITKIEFNDRLGKLGFDDKDKEFLNELIYRIPSISESIISYFRGEITESDLNAIADKNGINKDFLNILISANRKIVDVSDIRTIFYRGNKSDDWLNKSLSKIGYDDQGISDLKEIFPYFPQVPDLITFAVREVYSPAIRSEYGLDDDFPSEFASEALKQGVTTEQAKNYWASHWVLPSLLMGYEMLHRGVITDLQLKTLMRTQDIMPYWRDKLIDISYNPLTRVDIRRMYNTGILGEAEVLKAYKAVGYNDENAKLMTEFTKNFYQPAEKRLSRTDVLDGYQRKYLSITETNTLLSDLGYDQIEIDFYIAKADYKEAQELKKEAISLVGDMYKKSIVDDNEAISLLTKAGLEMAEINYNINKWTISKIGKTTLPAKEDLKAWIIGKIISRETYIEEMRSLGYADKYINSYLLQHKQKGL